MKKSNRKGFTIVELVIVIAVIAILAAVLIPTFSNLIKKANESADQQVIRNMNTILATYIESDKEISDVMAYLRSNGYSYEKMVANTKGYNYCYAKSTNQMYLVNDKNEVVYPKNANVSLSDLWAAYKDHATSIIPGINNYFAIQAVKNQTEFNTAFAEGTFVLDLNDNVCTVNGKENVTVLNGYVTTTGFAADSVAVAVKESDTTNTVKAFDDANKITKITYTNVLDPAGVGSGLSDYADNCTIEYVNCVFTKEPGFYQNGLSINLVFTNCTFVNYGTFAMQLQPGNDTNSKTPATVEIKDCDFVNTTRGIHIGGPLPSF
ncbi:MAG: type II secretion system protein, partial [Clostridia bacterium]|nr:type II secretion system protein [Clostridia bacterium]